MMAKKIPPEMSKLKSKISNLQSLRVLMVEDSEDDALLEIRELKKGGYDPVYERVETAVAMKKALSQKQWDIILCDYKLPKLSGPQAIAVLKETNIDIPLIIVSGAIGEETAVECMRLGAHDYIMKNNLSRLCAAIARELEEAKVRNKQRQTENTLQESETKLQAIFDKVGTGIFIIDRETQIITEANQTAIKMTGLSKERIIGQICNSLVCPALAGKCPAKDLGQSIHQSERKLIHADGHQIDILKTVYLITINGRNCYLESFIDITDRKLAEDTLKDSEEKYRTILENIEDGYYEVDLNGNFTFFNDSMYRILGYPQEEMMGMNNRQFTDKENAKKLFKTFNEVYRTGQSAKEFDWQIIRKDGTKRYIEVSVSLQKNSSGQPTGFRGIARDITERKQADEALRKSEAQYRLLADNMNDQVWLMDMNLKPTYISPSVEKSRGYTFEEIVQLPLDKQLTATSLQAAMEFFSSEMPRALADPTNYMARLLELEFYRKDGSTLWVENTFSLIRDKNGKPLSLLGTGRDITERKREEEKTLREKHFSDAVIDSLPGIFYLIDKKGQFARFNKNMADITGYSTHELSLFIATDVIKKEDRKLIKSKIEEAFNNGSAVAEAGILTKDGREIPYYFTAVRTTVRDNIFITGMGIDITERKKMEEALRQSEERYRTILDEMADAYFEVDLAGNYTFVNDAVCCHLGYSREELIGTTFRGQMVKEEFEKVYKAFGNIYITGKPERDIFYKLIRKDGTTGFAEMTGFPLKNQQGEVIGFRGVGRDITERKQAEEEHQQSFERMRNALRATVQAISMTVEMKDPYTSGHQQRVADLARSIATEMGLSADQLEFISAASTIHDIGKIAIPAEILSKPTKLSDLEFSIIKTHSQSGYDILKDIEFPWPVADVILQHHERMNGSGYPQGLKGDEIILEARIIAIADAVEAIASHRPYRPSLGIDFALEEISGNRGILYDADAVDACLRLFNKNDYKFK